MRNCLFLLKHNNRFTSAASSKSSSWLFSKTKTVTVVIISIKTLPIPRVTKAVDGVVNTKLNGYIIGIVDHLVEN